MGKSATHFVRRETAGPVPEPDESALKAARLDPDMVEIAPQHFMRRDTWLRIRHRLPIHLRYLNPSVLVRAESPAGASE